MSKFKVCQVAYYIERFEDGIKEVVIDGVYPSGSGEYTYTACIVNRIAMSGYPGGFLEEVNDDDEGSRKIFCDHTLFKTKADLIETLKKKIIKLEEASDE